PQDLMSDLRTFVAGATRAVKTNPLELARTALSILKTLPAARDAVLEYFCTLFDSAVSKYVTQIEVSTSTSGHEDATIVEIHVVLCSFVSSNPKAWAPIISTWSLELLGELSSRYAGRAHVPLSASLNETLQLWMSCRATRTLIDITTQCLSCLMHSDTESCINALLDTSVAHSPHFDWVVAHVGSCFPHTVITRAPKLNSVVGILGHLAGSHFVDIRSALLELFQWSLEADHHEADGENAERPATVPFLLQLASLSPTLLRALTTDVLHTLTPSMLPKLAALAPGWCDYCGGSRALEDLIVHLALGCEQGGTQILKLLLDAASPVDDTVTSVPDSPASASVKATSREILELLLQEIDHLLRSTMPGSYTIPLLSSIKQEITVIQPLLLSRDPLHVQTAVRLLGLLGYHSTAVLVSSAAFLLQRASTDDHLAALVRLVTGGVCNSTSASQSEQENGCLYKSGCLAQALEQAIRNNAGCILGDEGGTQPLPEQLWHNVARLLRWEYSGKAPSIRGGLISRAVRCNLREASDHLCAVSDSRLAHAVATALDLAIVGDKSSNDVYMLSVQFTLLMAKAAVTYFFLCVSEKDDLVRLRGVRLCCCLLAHLSSHSPPARSLALRELLEGSLFRSHSRLFGANLPPLIRAPREDVELLCENHKQGTSVMLAQRHSSVFHTGVIGYGPRKTQPNLSQDPDTVTRCTQLLIEVIKACCSTGSETGSEQSQTQPVSLDAITTVSLLLVELISPDVMYNGLPWPEEEFCKVTVERDLYIRRLFDDLPLIWHLMSLVASYRPALCYCSVLLRALTATLLAQWGSAAQRAQHNDKLLATTTQVLELMALGQLLPPPLSSLRDVIPYLKPQEVVQLLRDCVWNYLRDHVPSPALFARDENGLMWRDATLARPEPQYTDTLRSTMQNNIQHLGTLYSQLFPPTSSDSQN
ncbi:Integrator complex subunit 5, partial [Zootermopsis nevadensis]